MTIPLRTLTVDEGYRLTQFMRPGVRILMGATEAREAPVNPLPWTNIHRLPGFKSFFHWNLSRKLGFAPSAWAMFFGVHVMILGHDPTDDEWRWLCQRSTSLKDAQVWLVKVADQYAEREKEGQP